MTEAAQTHVATTQPGTSVTWLSWMSYCRGPPPYRLPANGLHQGQHCEPNVDGSRLPSGHAAVYSVIANQLLRERETGNPKDRFQLPIPEMRPAHSVTRGAEILGTVLVWSVQISQRARHGNGGKITLAEGAISLRAPQCRGASSCSFLRSIRSNFAGFDGLPDLHTIG
jgi:hypothetical protein